MCGRTELVIVQITATVECETWRVREEDEVWRTLARVVDSNDCMVDSFYGPVSEDWLPGEWDRVLTEAGYERIGKWDDFNLRCTARRL